MLNAVLSATPDKSYCLPVINEEVSEEGVRSRVNPAELRNVKARNPRPRVQQTLIIATPRQR